MSFPYLARRLADDPAITRVVGRVTSILAVAEPARAIAVAGLAEASGRRPLLVAVPTTAGAERLASDLELFLGPSEVMAFPAWETLPFERISPSIETMGRRLETLWHLQEPTRCPQVVVAPLRALMQRLSPGADRRDPIVIGAEDVVDVETLTRQLVGFGYRRETQVEHRGEFAVRGSIVDVFPSTTDGPYRIDLWGDEVDRLCQFTVADQRSSVDRAEVEIFPCRELLPTPEIAERAERLQATEPWGREQWQRLADGELFDGMESWLPWLTDEVRVLSDVIPPDGQVVLVEPTVMRNRGADLLAEEADLARSLAITWGAVDTEADGDRDRAGRSGGTEASNGGKGAAFPTLHVPFERLLAHTTAPVVTMTAVPEGPDVATLTASGWEPPGEALTARLHKLVTDKARVVVAADGAGTANRMADLLTDWGLEPRNHGDVLPDPLPPGVHLVVARANRGFVLPEAGIAVLTESDLTGRRRAHRQIRARKRQSEGFHDDLKPGNYVVHHQHGVGRFAGMVTRAIGGHERDYLLLEYKGDDKLYLPTDQIDLIRQFTGADSPTVHRLGGSDFAKAKSRVRSAVAEIAQELVVLYQKRISTPGHPFAPDTPWQREVEEAFPYELTPDQAKAIEEVKADMERPTPMDRLVVGDVGFGKTEIALRAVFKAVQDGTQAAVLVPTTLLAQQHYQTFADRLAPYPVRVEVLSRFLTSAQARKVVADVAAGEVDVLIGTHRLLSEDVTFDRLGLLVVDEEQRFGVAAKETLKGFTRRVGVDGDTTGGPSASPGVPDDAAVAVDVLTLSATPIPRTLEMSLTGIRDLSVLNTPPADRQPIMTYVGEYDERAAAEAIRRELLREGQVFFVHNRVESIEKVANDLQNLVPEARIAVAHGQMDEATLEKTVIDFWEGEYDVLVCTTIIESGIDMPTVNTLVVDRAELLGLGQLHQLRGRVGRSGQRAYAYLFTRPETALTDDAYERLKTIGEATDLGAGFRIAMRDLEIRGAGNLLGTGQSGHIAAVGYDLYCQMVTEAVATLSGRQPEPPLEIKIDIPGAANLPTDYVTGQAQRLEAYRKLAAVTDLDEVAEIRREWLDRYGPLPETAERLLDVARIRAHCARLGVTEVMVIGGPGFGGPEHVAKLGPVSLKASQEVRFKRLFAGGVWKPSEYGDRGGQLQVGLMKKNRVADDLVLFFETMFPHEQDAAA
ncbi:MAG: transcription-repair coupling factor [Acidimicrobiia bacterium]|nr:transcription-repair coupling factor [Acidimicrobiia bacterium]